MSRSIPILAVLASILLLGACATSPFANRTAPPGKVEHIVLVWLKNPGDAADRDALIAVAKAFPAQIREIEHLSVGTAVPSERDIVDDSFDVGFVMRFANEADLATYVDHPDHVNAVKEKLKPIAAKVVVYDIACR